MEGILRELCEPRCLDLKIDEGAKFLQDLCISGEIRDYDWIASGTNRNISIHQAIFLRLWKVWQMQYLSKTILPSEEAFLRVWGFIVLLPEYDANEAYNAAAISSNFIEYAMKRILTLSRLADSVGGGNNHGLSAMSSIFIIQQLLIRVYVNRLDLRSQIRQLLVKYLLCANQSGKDSERSNLDGGKSRAHVQYFLKILQAIIIGFKSSSDKDIFELRKELLVHVLIPLHLPNEMIEWRDQIPVIQMYHEDLVKCVVSLSQKSDDSYFDNSDRVTDSLLSEALLHVLRHWPESFNTNTPKQVLLLHEIEILVERLDVKRLLMVHDSLLDRLVKCVGTNADNIRPAQRALQFFKNNKVMEVIFPTVNKNSSLFANENLEEDGDNLDDEDDDESERFRIAKKSFEVLFPSLFRNGQPSWNPTVNKMTALALKRFMDINEVLVKKCIEEYFHRQNSGSRGHGVSRLSHSFSAKSDSFAASSLTGNNSLPTVGLPPRLGMKKPFDAVARMPGGDNGSNPPLMKPRTLISPSDSGNSSMSSNASGRKNPPITITGVAPWAMNNSTVSGGVGHLNTVHPSTTSSSLPIHTLPPSAFAQSKQQDGNVRFPSDLNTQRIMLPPAPRLHSGNGSITSTISESKLRDSGDKSIVVDHHIESNDSYFHLVKGYMVKLYPQIFASDGDATSLEAQGKDWCMIQAAAAPSLLPNLKFHDLVFGQILGNGAFSVVKYARHITKGKSQSEWPEYAVKLIDAAKVVEFQYSLSVIREISVLQLLQHPGIARMIQAFQYHGSAFLVLEYASRGDLHSYLLKAGRTLSTRHDLVRFIIGEVATAVQAIHDNGFVYNDLKPENILITELGHVKVTDFGACRPFSAASKRLVRESCQQLMDLPDGNWKVTSKDSEDDHTGVWRSIFQDPRLWEDTAMQSKSDGKDIDDDNDKASFTNRKAIIERAEGTPGYMPPEAFANDGTIQGDGMDTLVDAWSLGCVLYFCLHGKPRFYGEEPREIMEQMQVWFEEQAGAKHGNGHNHDHQVHFVHGVDSKDTSGDEHSVVKNLQTMAGSNLITQLLALRGSRISIAGVLDHPYLSAGILPEHRHKLPQDDAGLVEYDPRSLHSTLPPQWPEVSEDAGSQTGDRWSRRQFSTLWAPMPGNYNIQGDDSTAPAFLSGYLTGGGKNPGYESDMMHSVLRVPLPVAEESEQEIRCSFISKF